jgi:glycosyltransferase involved in cell wall biosynthesis
MTVTVVDDLHLQTDPQAHIARHAKLAGPDGKILIRCPDRSSTGVTTIREGDLARMLMRYARIDELATTDNGTIVAAADVCRRRGEIAIWTGWAIGPWHPTDIVKRGLGGSETAAVRLAEELAAMGWIVTLYGHFGQSGVISDVILRDFREFDPTREVDAFICFRDARQLDRRPNARFVALWLEDLAPAEGLTPARAANCDRICAVSHWHARQVIEQHPYLAGEVTPEGHPLVAACRNGIHRQWFLEEPGPERELRVIYSSSPDRGGDIILECWPAVREQVPDAELILTYSRWYDIVAQQFKQAYEHRARLVELLEQPGVRRVEGGLGQKALANLMRSSMVWAHPSWYSSGFDTNGNPGCEFHETSCISAMEAQAAGCVVVASNWGAIQETVAHGTLIDGDPREEDGAWRHAFVQAIVKGLTDAQVQKTAQEVGPEMVRDMGWDGAAEQLASMFPPPRPKFFSVLKGMQNLNELVITSDAGTQALMDALEAAGKS